MHYTPYSYFFLREGISRRQRKKETVSRDKDRDGKGRASQSEMMVSVAGRFFGNAYFYPSYKGSFELERGGGAG